MSKGNFGIVKGDIDGFLALFVDNISVILLIISLNLYVIGMPSEIVFGRIIPGAAVGLLVGNIYYAYLARKMTKEGHDVTALPCGISIVFAIAYTMGIIYPISKITGDPILAWQITIYATIIGGFICIIGAFIGPKLRSFIPKAAMLGALAGIGLIFIAGFGIDDIYSAPLIGLPALAIIIWGYFANGKLPFNLPTGLLALMVGTISATILGQNSFVIDNLSVTIPYPWILSIGKPALIQSIGYLSVIVPVAVINFIGTLNNIESASSVGDEYPIKNVMLADAIATIIGACFGCCYPNGVFIGHPAYKRLGAKVNYSLLNSVIIAAISILGLFEFVSNIIPMAAVTPVLIFVGLIMLEVSFTEVKKEHLLAVGISLVPVVPEVMKETIDMALNALNIPITEKTIAILQAGGVNYIGFSMLAYGTIVNAMILASVTVFLIQREFKKVSYVCILASVSSYIGLIHSPSLKLGSNIDVSIIWASFAIIALLVSMKKSKVEENNKAVSKVS